MHTGDFRAEPWFLESLTRNPYLQPYLYPHEAQSVFSKPTLSTTLEAIYLDTACVLSPLAVPSKDRATSGLVELMKLFPQSAYFFINSWTWGYEDVLKAIARAFQSEVRHSFLFLFSTLNPYRSTSTDTNILYISAYRTPFYAGSQILMRLRLAFMHANDSIDVNMSLLIMSLGSCTRTLLVTRENELCM